MIKVPKILIYGQPFNDLTGGGITISNLFKGWPKDRLATSFVAWDNPIYSTEICDNYYLVGREEHKWRFPLNCIKRPFPASGVISDKGKQPVPHTKSKITLRKALSDLINPILQWLGVYHFATRIILSDKQKAWIMDYKPEILYIQVSTIESIDFAHQLIDYLKIPSVIHIMDDWPTTLGRKGPFACFWSKKVTKEFIKLLDKTSCCLTISDAMAIEYKKRYGKNFEAYHNPVEIDQFKLVKTETANEKDVIFKVLYMGRIGTANKQSIKLFANSIAHTKFMDREVRLEIYTKDLNEPLLKSISRIQNVTVYPAIPHNQIPNLLTRYDLLLLPLDFTKVGFSFAKYSLPTKATEYMLSGTPIMVFAPEATAVSRFFREHDCGYCLTNNSPDAIRMSLNFLLSNEQFCVRISNNAVRIAKEKFDAEKVRDRFRETLIKIVQQKNVL